MKTTQQSGWCGAHSKPLARYYTAAPIRKAQTLTEADVAGLRAPQENSSLGLSVCPLHLDKCRIPLREPLRAPSLPISLAASPPLPATLTTHQPYWSSVESLDTVSRNGPTLGLDTCCSLRPEPSHSHVLIGNPAPPSYLSPFGLL